MRHKLVYALLAALALPLAAQAAPDCGPIAQVISGLDRIYQERVLWQGIDGRGGRVILTARPDGKSWTALQVTGTNACVVAAGERWAPGPVLAITPDREG